MPSITEEQIKETKKKGSYLILNGDPNQDTNTSFVVDQKHNDVRAKTAKDALKKVNANGFQYTKIKLKAILLPDAVEMRNRRVKVWVPSLT
jgi:hypothetical protein